MDQGYAECTESFQRITKDDKWVFSMKLPMFYKENQ